MKEFGCKYDVSKPWIFDVKPNKIADIVISRSSNAFRIGKNVDWNVLRDYEDKCIFYGLEHEYDTFVKNVGLDIAFHMVTNVIHYASIIKGSNIFIGNSTFGYALAEGMKHPRVLEMPCYSSEMSLTIPQSYNGHISLSKDILERYL